MNTEEVFYDYHEEYQFGPHDKIDTVEVALIFNLGELLPFELMDLGDYLFSSKNTEGWEEANYSFIQWMKNGTTNQYVNNVLTPVKHNGENFWIVARHNYNGDLWKWLISNRYPMDSIKFVPDPNL